MKYLKGYNESVSSDIENDIKDILLPLIDDGFECGVRIGQYINIGQFRSGVSPICVVISKEYEINNTTTLAIFEYSQIKDSVKHLVSFLHEKGYKLGSCSAVFDGRSDRNCDINMSDNVTITILRLTFDL